MRILLIIVGVALSAGCATRSAVSGSLAGTYEWNIWTAWTTLELLPSGDYVAKSGMDIYLDSGSAHGTWRSEGDVVYLEPKKEEGDLEGELRALAVRIVDGKRALIRKQDLGKGFGPFGYFYLKAEPNQPVQINAVDAPRNLRAAIAISRSPRRV